MVVLNKTKPGNQAGFRQSTAMMGEQQPSHHGNAVTGTLGRAYTSKAEVELSGPRTVMGTYVLKPPEAPTDIRLHKDRFRPASMPFTHGVAPFRLPGLTARQSRPLRDRPNDRKESPVTADFTARAIASTVASALFPLPIEREVS